ncbi:S-adenosyl-L-methionine-dependent methyltransferase [Dendryphion nanum]|uniref:tRNA (adenine(58)-N(1))-methyltransferase catalytic subunit TRM61 n=1 Tax=Dendryphion nanum TaxID=256645 RepID=A0A9P9IPM0_9PLEO|nr:S-adenosyl-L-methionine-dependent methyltransferase [Dendryphion nanum]
MRHPLFLRCQPLRILPIGSRIRHFGHSSNRGKAFDYGDNVLIRSKKGGSSEGTIVKLRESKVRSTHHGDIQHDDIVGLSGRQVVRSSKGIGFRVHEPTLAEYVRLTPRLVTPIYPSDANLIVSLLDIHVDTCSAGTSGEAPLEILEAGTGHGALTLHLSRAIHAANPPLPKVAPHIANHTEDDEDEVNLGESVSDLQESNLASWKASRRAILHTLDISPKYSAHAKKIVHDFRHGIYSNNVDFHVGDVSAWISAQKESRKSQDPFLSYILLDLPGSPKHLANAASALYANGVLSVFNPSITQIADCVETIRENNLPFALDQVIELGAANIRQWDVRAVRPRATLSNAENSESQSKHDAPIEGQTARDDELATDLAREQEEWAMVCRPKVGEKVIGGGFLGIWRRMDMTAGVGSAGVETPEPE